MLPSVKRDKTAVFISAGATRRYVRSRRRRHCRLVRRRRYSSAAMDVIRKNSWNGGYHLRPGPEVRNCRRAIRAGSRFPIPGSRDCGSLPGRQTDKT